jgi:hypothetical protein
MTVVAPASIPERLRALLTTHNITHAVLVDDSARAMIRGDVWIDLRRLLEEDDANTWAAIVDVIEEKGLQVNVTAPPFNRAFSTIAPSLRYSHQSHLATFYKRHLLQISGFSSY